MNMTFETNGVCASSIKLNVEDGIVKSVTFENGCGGNTAGIAKLVEGMRVEDVIERIKGIRCGQKSTSCPDQLARALEQIKGK